MPRTTKRSKKVLIASGTAAVVLAGSGVAFAYWTTSGSGSGTATVATSAQTLVLHASTSGTLSPGGSLAVFFSADNGSSGSLQVGTVRLVSITADSEHAGCSVADFSMADVAENQTIAANSTAVALSASGTLVYADTSVDQSACKGATLTLDVSSN
ncbi:MAG: hypothetical protein M3Y42_19435 [Actinomycetota bacterium]|nr:hypothetical protein [Actinomycetota bacterium]